jgi:hypothetical protein
MNRNLRKFLVLVAGIVFGIVLTKGEIISWYRIYEMFRFKSFHMYGVMGSAVMLGMVFYQYSRRRKLKTADGGVVTFAPKEKRYTAALIGGVLFGMGWALTGACPGPIYITIGNGFLVFGVVLLSAVLGTLVYGLIRNRLPH